MKRKRRILIVEDEPIVALTEKKVLTNHGYEVLIASEPEAALEAVDGNTFNLILMDIDLGVGRMDGTQLAEIILKDNEIPIVFCTSHTEKETVDKVRGITRYGYIVKNSGEFVLTETVNMALMLFAEHEKSERHRERLTDLLEELEKSKEAAEKYLNLSAEIIISLDTDGIITLLNDNGHKILEYEPGELIGKEWISTCIPVNSRDEVRNVFNKLMSGRIEQLEKVESSIVTKTGKEKIISWYNTLLRDEENNIKGLLSSGEDITDLKEALEEKDFLLRELNHRIKNNLALIKSLVGLKESETEEDIDFTDVYNQIEAIRIVHDKLYRTEKITHIEFADYVHDLLTTIFTSFSKAPFTLQFDIDPISVGTKTAVSLGLIVNEIATNTLKHGLTPAGEAHFSIHLEADTERKIYVLTISNSGKPFPEKIDMENPGTLGLLLIQTLVSQVNGKLELQREPHPVYKITIPKIED